MLTQFHFSDFIPDDELKALADQALDEITRLAPYDSTAVALLKKQDHQYRCSIDIYSRQGPFIANAVHPSPFLAILHAQGALSDDLNAWRKERLEFEAQRAISFRNVGMELTP